MKKVALCLPAFSFLLHVGLFAQSAQQVGHAPDAGTFEIMASIFIPPIAKAPFTATVSAEWVRTLEDGGTITLENHRVVMRDGLSRIYQERRRLVAPGQEPPINGIEISDPSAHQKFFCSPETHTCQVHGYFAEALAETGGPAGPDEEGSLTREDLGSNHVSSLEAVGTRETRTIRAGVMGNDRPLSITKEFWYSPQLGINLVVKRADPRHGAQTFTVSDIGLAEPDPRYFSLPQGYPVMGQPSGRPPAGQAASSN